MVDTTRRCGVFIRTRTHHEDAHSATKANAKCIKVCHMAERMCKLETEAENWKRQSWLQYAWAGLEAQAKTWHSQVNCELYFVVWIGKFLIITICRTKTQTKKKTRRRKFDDVDVGRLPVDEPVIIDAWKKTIINMVESYWKSYASKSLQLSQTSRVHTAVKIGGVVLSILLVHSSLNDYPTKRLWN